MKKLLLTGASGYLGGRLRDYFTRQMPEWEVVCFSLRNGLAGLPDNLSAIVHAAGLDASACGNDPVLAHKVNVEMTRHLVQAAVEAQVRQFVFLSSVHVYGSPLAGQLDETMALPHPGHPYATTKKAAEDEVLALQKSNTCQPTVLRLTNAFGSPASYNIKRWELIVNDLCRMAVMDGRLVLRTSGSQRRDFVTVTDVCRAVGHVLENHVGGLYNLGGEQVLTLREMAELVADRATIVLGFRPEIVALGAENVPDWPNFAVPIDRLKATGFSLLKNVAEEIEQTLLFCREFGESAR